MVNFFKTILWKQFTGSTTNFEDVVNNISKLIDTLPEKPSRIGHSMAGMAVLKLTGMGKAAAAVSLDGASSQKCISSFYNC